ncbi:MAG: ribosome silencing factor [Solirubrobacterales bacterium]
MSEREAAVARARAEEPESSEDLARRVAAMADEKLGEDIVVLDMRELVSYTDFLVLVTARNERLSKAIADDVHIQLKSEGLLPTRAEGVQEARWVLLDYLDWVLHVFVPETREHYRLEQLWGEAPRLEL